MNNPLIFLDLDGPVIPFSFPENISPFAIPEEEFPFNSRFDEKAKQHVIDLCEEFGARVVTNSTHNSEFWGGWGHIQSVFYYNNMEQFLEDRTLYRNGIENRLQAVESYLDTYDPHNPVKFVIFDDDYRDFPEDSLIVQESYVQTGAYGITEKEYQRAREILKR